MQEEVAEPLEEAPVKVIKKDKATGASKKDKKKDKRTKEAKAFLEEEWNGFDD